MCLVVDDILSDFRVRSDLICLRIDLVLSVEFDSNNVVIGWYML